MTLISGLNKNLEYWFLRREENQRTQRKTTCSDLLKGCINNTINWINHYPVDSLVCFSQVTTLNHWIVVYLVNSVIWCYPLFQQLVQRFYLVFISWAAFMKLLHVSENVGNLSSKDSTCFSTDINYKKRSLLCASLHGFYLVCFFISSVPWNSNTWKILLLHHFFQIITVFATYWRQHHWEIWFLIVLNSLLTTPSNQNIA